MAQEVRCPKCGRLLFRYEGKLAAEVEVKCRRCKAVVLVKSDGAVQLNTEANIGKKV